MNKQKRYILFGVIALLILCLILLLVRCGNSYTQEAAREFLPADEGAVEWKGNQSLGEPHIPGSISIPGFSTLSFVADQTQQRVNFYNPETNNCMFLMSLYVEDELYWQSGYVEAGKGYYSIELYESLPTGEYAAMLQIQCFRASGEPLNSANVAFDLSVLEVH